MLPDFAIITKWLICKFTQQINAQPALFSRCIYNTYILYDHTTIDGRHAFAPYEIAIHSFAWAVLLTPANDCHVYDIYWRAQSNSNEMQ